jgi:Flp pilus assembly protein TadD
VALLHLGDLAGAERSARRALQNASEEAGPHWLLGYVLYRREEARQEALQHMRYAARTIKEAKQFLEIAGQ